MDVYPVGYLEVYTDQQQKALGWHPHSAAGVSCCCWGLPSAQASGDTWGPRSADPYTPSDDVPTALYPRCSSGSLASAAEAGHTSSATLGREMIGVIKGFYRLVKKKSCKIKGERAHPWHMLPASIYIMFHPAQHSPVHFLFRWHIEIVTGDQIQDLGR